MIKYYELIIYYIYVIARQCFTVASKFITYEHPGQFGNIAQVIYN